MGQGLLFWDKTGWYGMNGNMEDGLIKSGRDGRTVWELTNQLMDPTVLNQPGMIHKLNKERTELESRRSTCGLPRAKKQLEDVAAFTGTLDGRRYEAAVCRGNQQLNQQY